MRDKWICKPMAHIVDTVFIEVPMTPGELWCQGVLCLRHWKRGIYCLKPGSEKMPSLKASITAQKTDWLQTVWCCDPQLTYSMESYSGRQSHGSNAPISFSARKDLNFKTLCKNTSISSNLCHGVTKCLSNFSCRITGRPQHMVCPSSRTKYHRLHHPQSLNDNCHKA